MTLSLGLEEYQKNLRESDDDYQNPYNKKTKYETIDNQINEIDYELERIKPKHFNEKNDRNVLKNMIMNKKNPQGLHEYEEKLYSLLMKEPIIKKENFLKSLSKSINRKDMAILNLKLLDYAVLKEIMETCGSFPAKSRNYIWKYLLSLPGDKDLFEFYSIKGIHPFYKNLNETFKVKELKDFRRLQQMCSIVSFWSPHVGNVYFLPNLIFPFIKLIHGDDMFLFEVLISILNTFCQYWFEFYPGAPLNHLKICEKIIGKESSKLFYHFKRLEEECKQSSMKISEIIWRLLKDIFSESLCKENWLQLIDFILIYNHKPEILLYVSCSYLISSENLLLKCLSKIDVESVLFSGTNRNLNLNLIKIFKNSVRLMEKYSRFQIYKYKPHIPFPNNRYPAIDKFPLDFLGTTAKLKEELFIEEENFELKKKKIDEIESKFFELAKKEKMMQKSYESLIHKEKEKGEIMKRELDLIIYQKEKFYDEMKNRKIEKVNKLENLIESSLKFYEKMNNTEIATFEEEMRKKKSLEEFDLKQRLQQEELNNLEFDANRKILQLMNLRVKDEEDQKYKILEESKGKEREMNRRILEEKWKLEDEGMQKQTENARNLKELEFLQKKGGNYYTKKEIKEKVREYEQSLMIKEVDKERRNRAAQGDNEEKRLTINHTSQDMPTFNERVKKGAKNSGNYYDISKENDNSRENNLDSINNYNDNSINHEKNYDYPHHINTQEYLNKNNNNHNSGGSSLNEFSSPTISSDNKNSTHTNLRLINEGIRNLTSTSSPYNNYYSSNLNSTSQEDNSGKIPINISDKKLYRQDEKFKRNAKINEKEYDNNNDLVTSSFRSSNNDLEETDSRYDIKYNNSQNENKRKGIYEGKYGVPYESLMSMSKSNNIASLGSLSLSQSNS